MYKMRIRLAFVHKYDIKMKRSPKNIKKKNIPHDHFR